MSDFALLIDETWEPGMPQCTVVGCERLATRGHTGPTLCTFHFHTPPDVAPYLAPDGFSGDGEELIYINEDGSIEGGGTLTGRMILAEEAKREIEWRIAERRASSPYAYGVHITRYGDDS